MQTSGCLILSSICLIIELITSIYLKILMAREKKLVWKVFRNRGQSYDLDLVGWFLDQYIMLSMGQILHSNNLFGSDLRLSETL